jgi:hypothetical protein
MADVAALEERVAANAYDYDAHVALVEAYRAALPQPQARASLRRVRERLSASLSLPEGAAAAAAAVAVALVCRAVALSLAAMCVVVAALAVPWPRWGCRGSGVRPFLPDDAAAAAAAPPLSVILQRVAPRCCHCCCPMLCASPCDVVAARRGVADTLLSSRAVRRPVGAVGGRRPSRHDAHARADP